jgi:predicted acetylornithine/succinylornithine family transaminase
MSIKDAPLMQTYGRSDLTFVSGNGCILRDSNGKEYLDALAGIAVVSAGHSNLAVAEAICNQASKLQHVSNLFWTEPMAQLAARLSTITGGWGKVFFANSGAEANECAFKLARLWAGEGRYKILCAEGSFHGRTLASLAATGQPAKWVGFEPLPEGFTHLPFNNLDAFAQAIDCSTAAIMVEPIQGENGVIPATQEFLQGLRELCDKHQLALIFDEVQTGIGRTGSWWAFQSYNVKPDIFTSAKALGNGLPIGACIANDQVASSFQPGHHATTFGGGPLICSAALATLDFLEQEKVIEAIPAKEAILKALLSKIPGVAQVRGKGLMLATVLEAPIAKDVACNAMDQGLIVNAVRDDVLRITPPLVISKEEIGILAERLGKAIELARQ